MNGGTCVTWVFVEIRSRRHKEVWSRDPVPVRKRRFNPWVLCQLPKLKRKESPDDCVFGETNISNTSSLIGPKSRNQRKYKEGDPVPSKLPTEERGKMIETRFRKRMTGLEDS